MFSTPKYSLNLKYYFIFDCINVCIKLQNVTTLC